jgi:hypothetical protein
VSAAPRNAAYRVVAVDLDGTLAGADGLVTARTVAALRDTEASGIRVVIITGRAYPVPLAIWRAAHLSAPLITCGGALVIEPPAMEVLRARSLTFEVASSCVRLGRELGVDLSLWTRDAIWMSRPSPMAERLRQLNQVDVPIFAPGRGAPVPLGPQPVFKAMFGGEPASLDLAQPVIATQLSQADVTRSMPEYIDVEAHGAAKWDALEAVLLRLGSSPAGLVAIGDGENDIRMLEMAALAVAPSNAMPRVKASADLVVGDHDREGIATFLEGLCGTASPTTSSCPL